MYFSHSLAKELRNAVVLWDTHDTFVYVFMWLNAYVYTYNTTEKLIISQTNNFLIMFGNGVCSGHYRTGTWKVISVQLFPN